MKFVHTIIQNFRIHKIENTSHFFFWLSIFQFESIDHDIEHRLLLDISKNKYEVYYVSFNSVISCSNNEFLCSRISTLSSKNFLLDCSFLQNYGHCLAKNKTYVKVLLRLSLICSSWSRSMIRSNNIPSERLPRHFV